MELENECGPSLFEKNGLFLRVYLLIYLFVVITLRAFYCEQHYFICPFILETVY